MLIIFNIHSDIVSGLLSIYFFSPLMYVLVTTALRAYPGYVATLNRGLVVTSLSQEYADVKSLLKATSIRILSEYNMQTYVSEG